MNFNWTRFFLGTLVAVVICFFSDGFLHEKLLSAEWAALFENLRVAPPQPHNLALLYFAIFELGRGLLMMVLYVLMRGCCGPGPKTAVLAGLVTWLAFSVTGPAQFIPLGFFSHALWLKAGAFQLVSSIVAALAGAVLYKDAS